jgi:hypothetical protein
VQPFLKFFFLNNMNVFSVLKSQFQVPRDNTN